MGIITRIEERIGGMIEKPFQLGQGLDLVQVEIILKRFIEKHKKTFLDKIYVYHSYIIVLNDDLYTENEPFIRHYSKLLKSYVTKWLQEKDYKIKHAIDINFVKGNLQRGLFEIHISNEQSGSQRGLLEVRSGNVFILQNPITIIGRGEDCHICLTDDTVSKKHAQISSEKDRCVLTDFCSSNGTRVDKGKVTTVLLHGGEKILFGSVACVYISSINS